MVGDVRYGMRMGTVEADIPRAHAATLSLQLRLSNHSCRQVFTETTNPLQLHPQHLQIHPPEQEGPVGRFSRSGLLGICEFVDGTRKIRQVPSIQSKAWYEYPSLR